MHVLQLTHFLAIFCEVQPQGLLIKGCWLLTLLSLARSVKLARCQPAMALVCWWATQKPSSGRALIM